MGRAGERTRQGAVPLGRGGAQVNSTADLYAVFRNRRTYARWLAFVPMKAPLAAALIALSACSGESPENPAPEGNVAAATVAAPRPAPAAPEAQARSVKEETALLDFSYGWPAEASAIPALEARLESDLEKNRREALAAAGEDRKSRGADIPFHGHYLHKVWEKHGATPGLLSLSAAVGTFTGGAHGNVVFDSILWDRKSGRALAFADLFADREAVDSLSGAYCEALDRERAKKREETLPLQGEGWMVECPPLGEQVIVPVDADGNGRFETLSVLIPPYGAGPYAEGSYVVDLPVTDALRARIRPDYSGSF